MFKLTITCNVLNAVSPLSVVLNSCHVDLSGMVSCTLGQCPPNTTMGNSVFAHSLMACILIAQISTGTLSPFPSCSPIDL